jgi:hypothetical protein
MSTAMTTENLVKRIYLVSSRLAFRALWLASLLFALSLPSVGAVDVATMAGAGFGIPGVPWTGWDTAITWEPETEYFFRKGYYAYSVSPNFLKTGIVLRGEAGTVLQFNGVGNAVVFDNPGGTGDPYKDWTMNVRMENFIIQGNANATNGLFLRAVRNGIFRHISVRDVANACLWTEALVTNIVDNFRCTHQEMPNHTFNVVPAYGIVLGVRGTVYDSTTTTVITNPVIEGVSQIGIWLQAKTAFNEIIGGTSETNLGKGMVIDGSSNMVIGMDLEVNGGTNIEINEANNQIINVMSEGLIDVRRGYLNRVRCRCSHITIQNSADYTDISGSMITVALVDLSQTTVKYGYFLKTEFRNDSFVGNVVDAMYSIPVAGGAIATDARQGKLFSSVITGDTMLANPTNGVDGQLITWRIQQDTVGGHALTFGSLFEGLSGQGLSTPANSSNPAARFGHPGINLAPLSFTEIAARFNAPANKWQIR